MFGRPKRPEWRNAKEGVIDMRDMFGAGGSGGTLVEVLRKRSGTGKLRFDYRKFLWTR